MQLTNLTLLIVFSILYISGVSILYFSKSRLKNEENKLYGYLLITNLIGLILQLSCSFVSINYDIFPKLISDIIIRLMLVYLIIWVTLMLIYLFTLAGIKKSKNILFIGIMVIASLLVFILPFDLYRNPDKAVYYSYGIAPQITFIYSTFISVIMFFILIIKRKNINTKKTIPIWVFLILGIFMMFIQMMAST